MVLDEVVAVNSSDQAVCLEELFLPGGLGCVWEVTMWGWSFVLLYYDSHRYYYCFRTLARSLEPVATECKKHTIRTQTKTNG